MRSDTTPAGERDLLAVWRSVGDRILSLLGTAHESVLEKPVPTVEGAVVGSVLEHLIATSNKASENRAGVVDSPVGLPSPPATDRRPDSLADLLVRWEKAAGSICDQVESDPALATTLITYAVMAEHDLRTAIDSPGARSDTAVKIALDELSGRFSDRAERAQLPALRVTVEQWGTIIGDGSAVSCVVADRFEFVRAMSGRRSGAEIRQWNWGVDAGVYIPVIAETSVPDREIHERDPRIPEHMRDREFTL
jgi:hypothetical protein